MRAIMPSQGNDHKLGLSRGRERERERERDAATSTVFSYVTPLNHLEPNGKDGPNEMKWNGTTGANLRILKLLKCLNLMWMLVEKFYQEKVTDGIDKNKVC
jgi:hypothetical protein